MGQRDQKVTPVLRKILPVLTSKPSESASCLLPSDLPSVGSTLHTYNVHSPGDVWCIEMNAKKKKLKRKCISSKNKKKSKPCLWALEQHLFCRVKLVTHTTLCLHYTATSQARRTPLPGANGSRAPQFLVASVDTELCSSLQKWLGDLTFYLGETSMSVLTRAVVNCGMPATDM